jgi:hypothetical protein
MVALRASGLVCSAMEEMSLATSPISATARRVGEVVVTDLVEHCGRLGQGRVMPREMTQARARATPLPPALDVSAATASTPVPSRNQSRADPAVGSAPRGTSQTLRCISDRPRSSRSAASRYATGETLRCWL